MGVIRARFVQVDRRARVSRFPEVGMGGFTGFPRTPVDSLWRVRYAALDQVAADPLPEPNLEANDRS
jgi:hypothetical protein